MKYNVTAVVLGNFLRLLVRPPWNLRGWGVKTESQPSPPSSNQHFPNFEEDVNHSLVSSGSRSVSLVWPPRCCDSYRAAGRWTTLELVRLFTAHPILIFRDRQKQTQGAVGRTWLLFPQIFNFAV